jgi:hypothetical protein
MADDRRMQLRRLGARLDDRAHQRATEPEAPHLKSSIRMDELANGDPHPDKAAPQVSPDERKAVAG